MDYNKHADNILGIINILIQYGYEILHKMKKKKYNCGLGVYSSFYFHHWNLIISKGHENEQTFAEVIQFPLFVWHYSKETRTSSSLSRKYARCGR